MWSIKGANRETECEEPHLSLTQNMCRLHFRTLRFLFMLHLTKKVTLVQYLRMPGGELQGQQVGPQSRVRSGHRSHSHKGPQTPSLQQPPNPWLPQFQEILSQIRKKSLKYRFQHKAMITGYTAISNGNNQSNQEKVRNLGKLKMID